MMVKNKIKFLVLLVAASLFTISFIPVGNASKNYSTENINLSLDIDYLYNLSENLSNIIFTEYDESAGEIAKGRAFGTKGEHKAAEIIFENMSDLGLDPKYEKINNTCEQPFLITKLDINEIELNCFNKSNNKTIEIDDFYNSGNWNLTGIKHIINFIKIQNPLIGLIFERFVKSIIIRRNGSFDKNYNIYDIEQLNYNFSYKNLKVVKKPFNHSFLKDIQSGKKYNEPFVYISKDFYFTNWTKEKVEFEGFIYNSFFKIFGRFFSNFVSEVMIEELLIRILQPNCKGLIVVDSNYDTYNMAPYTFHPLPIISINRSVGEEILENPDNFEIDFYVNQEYNNSVESYNVIGSIEGINKNETVIISSLYDSWWCQGTADSAIAMSMVLTIAKYFKENNIIPKRNIKFIAFGAEEYGFRGAEYYEYTHRDEFVSYVLDLNQLGYTPQHPENIRLQIWSNDEIVNQSMVDFLDKTNYSKRTGVDFATRIRIDGGPSNTRPFAESDYANIRNCKTILFVKTGIGFNSPNWLHHHRDGIDHTHGDVIDYFNITDTEVTTELALNVTKYLAIEKEDEEVEKDTRFGNRNPLINGLTELFEKKLFKE